LAEHKKMTLPCKHRPASLQLPDHHAFFRLNLEL
jgi:hypothetical protein